MATLANCHQCLAAARHAACTWSRRCTARTNVETLQSCKRTACPGSGKRVRNAEIVTLPRLRRRERRRPMENLHGPQLSESLRDLRRRLREYLAECINSGTCEQTYYEQSYARAVGTLPGPPHERLRYSTRHPHRPPIFLCRCCVCAVCCFSHMCDQRQSAKRGRRLGARRRRLVLCEII